LAYVRLFSGDLKAGDKIRFIGAEAESEIVEVGYFSPMMQKTNRLSEGEIGYVVTGLKRLEYCKVGDTVVRIQEARHNNQKITNKQTSNSKFNYFDLALEGYKEVKPMVFAGIFCKEGSEYARLRESLEKLKLADAALMYEPESSSALGFGFRCGFLGLLHLEIVQERLHREYGIDLIVTVPSVAYRVKTQKTNNKKQEEDGFTVIHSPQELPDAGQIVEVEEPWVKADVVGPKKFLGAMMQLVQDKRGMHKNTEYFTEDSVILHFEIPLGSILVDFYDKLKSATKGYATLNYEFLEYRAADVQRMDILVAEEPVEALATIVYKDQAHEVGKKIVHSLKELLPRQMFEVKLQAALNYQDHGKNKGGKIIASAKIPAMRKDVTAKLYGGDVTRKRKLLEKQKKCKKKMKSMGKVDIPTEAFMAVLKR